MPRKNKAPPAQASARHVIITVSGGVAEVLCKPMGLIVSIFDYDVEGEADVDRDPDGRNCRINQWPAGDEVAGNRHWPIVREAIAAARPYSRQWKCPACGRTVDCSYEDLAEAGTPLCGECDREMTLL